MGLYRHVYIQGCGRWYTPLVYIRSHTIINWTFLFAKWNRIQNYPKKIRRVYLKVDTIAIVKLLNVKFYSNIFYDDIKYFKYQYINLVVCLCQSLLFGIKDQQDIPMKSKWHWREFIVFYNLVENWGSIAIDLFT